MRYVSKRALLFSSLIFPLGVVPTQAWAACTTVGTVTRCDSGTPNPWTTPVGEGNTAPGDNRTVEVQGGSEISTGDSHGVSLRDNADITIRTGGTIRNAATTAGGQFGTGGNTIEIRNNGTVTIEQGGQLLATGTQGQAEAVNFQGTGNTVINNGTIDADRSVAIWSQNLSGLNTVINNETGVIESFEGATSTVIGGSGNGALDFTNRGTVKGSIKLAGGNDVLRLYTGSTISGNFSGGAGNDQIFLSGTGQSSLPGDFDGFESLIKNDTGTWTLTGAIVGVTVTDVQNGTLILTGNNTAYVGQVLVQPTGIVQARAQSLPPTVTNDGLVRFDQIDDGTYAGAISGSGVVEKQGAGVLTLAPNAAGNSYSGGTRINEGVIAIGVDNALGAPTGGITFNGGALRYNGTFDLADTRAIVVDAGGGTIDTQTFNTTISQNISGAGGLTKTGAGTLTVNSDAAHTGGTTVEQGTLAVGDADTPGALLSGGGPVEVAAGATLGGYGSVVGAVTNNGTIAVADALAVFAGGPTGNFRIDGSLSNAGLIQIGGAAVGNMLTVAGDYIGQDGTLALNTFLGSDGSPSDKLVVDGGSATGSTSLAITNVGGPGVQTVASGIMVIEALNGATTNSGAFTLDGPVSAGPFDYYLFRGGTTGGTENNWYLRNTIVETSTEDPPATPPESAPLSSNGITPPVPTNPNLPAPEQPAPPTPGATPLIAEVIPLYRREVPTYAVVPPIARQAALATLGTFHERRGGQSALTGNENLSAAWVRGFGQSIERNWAGTAAPSIDGTLWGAQVGLDALQHEGKSGHRDTAGLFASYTLLNGGINGFAVGWNNLAVGDANLDMTSVGAYWTHIGPTGWYLDAVVMGSLFGGNTRSTRGIGIDIDGKGVSASLEGGAPIALTQNWVIEPQAQIIWQHMSVDDRNDGFSDVDFDTGDAFTGRVGLRLQGTFNQIQPYLKANAWHAFDGQDDVYFDGFPITTEMDGTSVELGGGLIATLQENVSMFAAADYTFDVDGERQRALEGNVGIRVKW